LDQYTIYFSNRFHGESPTKPPHDSRVLAYFYPIWGVILPFLGGPYDMKRFKSKN